MAKKNILFVGSYPPPYGGIASHLYELLPELVKSGYEIICITQSLNDRIINSSGMKTIFLSIRRYFYKNIFSVLRAFVAGINDKKDMKWLEFLRTVTFSRAIIEIVKEQKIDAVFLYEVKALVIPVLRTNFGKSFPIVLMIFGEYYLDPNKFRNMFRYMNNIFSNCDIILSSSQYCANSISRIFGYDFPVRVVYIGVDDQIYLPYKSGKHLRDELGIPITSTVFFFLGRMTKDMGLDFLLRVADRLLSVHSENYLILAGAKGDLSIHAKQLADREPRVKYCLNIPSDKKTDFYNACDIFLAPTMEHHACMGVSIKEALACAKPVIASTSGGIPEAIEDGVNGYLIPFEKGKLDEEVFLKRVKRLVNDPLLRFKMGEKGREKVLKLFTNDKTTQQYLRILDSLNKK